MMDLKTAVFTAEHGYKWTTPPEGISEAQLSRYGKAIDNVYREGMGTSDYIQGVIYDGSLVAVFSALRTAPGWDTAGRAACYYAVAFVERVQWPHVNFDILLKDPFFLRPDKHPPAEIGYSGPVSSKVDESVLSLFANGGKGPERIDFSCLGEFLSIHFQLGLNWRFYRSNMQNWHGPELVFEKNLMFGAVAPRPASTITEAANVSNSGEEKGSAMVNNDSNTDLPSADVAKFSVKVKCMRQDIDANRGQILAITRRVRHLTIAVIVLVVLNICLVALGLYASGVLNKVQSHSEEGVFPSKQEEKVNKRCVKNAAIADVASTNISITSDQREPANDSSNRHQNDGNTPSK